MLSRAALARANGLAVRRTAARRSWQRFQSTSSSGSSASFGASHAVAGVAGGATVVLAGYVWYHTSGLKTAVQTSKDVKVYLQSTRDTVVQKARESAKNPSQALAYLRSVAKSYASFVPGAAGYVDATFDEIDSLRDAHGDELDKIVGEATEELQKAANEGGADAKTATRIYEILHRSMSRMQELGKKAGSDLLEKNPAIKEKLGSGYEQLKSLAEKGGPEAKKVLDDVTKQLKEIASRGSMNEETLQKLRQLLQDKTSQLRKMAGASGTGAMLEGGSDKLQALLSAVPGGDEIKEKAPHLEDIMNLASERSDEAKALAKETFQDVINVLEDKGKKAKELADRTKDDGAKKTKSSE